MDYINIGKFYGTHEIKGEIKLKSSFEYLSKVLTKDFVLYVGKDKHKVILNTFRPFKDVYLVLFKDKNNINDVTSYVNELVYIKRSDLELKSSEYVKEDLIGLKVYFDNEEVGVITNIIDYGKGNSIIEIKGIKEVLVPYNNHFIDKVEKDIVYLKNVGGLIDEN